MAELCINWPLNVVQTTNSASKVKLLESFLCFQNKIQACDMETGEKKTNGSKEESHPSGENAKLSPTNATAPAAEPATPELPKVEYRQTFRPRRGMSQNRQTVREKALEFRNIIKKWLLLCTTLGPVY